MRSSPDEFKGKINSIREQANIIRQNACLGHETVINLLDASLNKNRSLADGENFELIENLSLEQLSLILLRRN